MLFKKLLLVGMVALFVGTQCSSAAGAGLDFLDGQSDFSYSDEQDLEFIDAQRLRTTDAQGLEFIEAQLSGMTDVQDKKNKMLLYAANASNTKKVKTLLAQKADVDAVEVVSASDNKWGFSALHIAAKRGNADMVLALLAAKASIDSKGNAFGKTTLHEAAAIGNAKIVQQLLDEGASIEARNNIESTALHYAAQGSTDVVRLLLGNRACIEATNDFGLTALHEAAVYGDGDTVSVLLAAGACADKIADRGRAPFCSAVLGRNLVTISVLLNAYYDALKKKCPVIADMGSGNPENQIQVDLPGEVWGLVVQNLSLGEFVNFRSACKKFRLLECEHFERARKKYAVQLKEKLILCVEKGAREAQSVAALKPARQAMMQLFQAELVKAQGLEVDKLLQGLIISNGQPRLSNNQQDVDPKAQQVCSLCSCSCPCAIS